MADFTSITHWNFQFCPHHHPTAETRLNLIYGGYELLGYIGCYTDTTCSVLRDSDPLCIAIRQDIISTAIQPEALETDLTSHPDAIKNIVDNAPLRIAQYGTGVGTIPP